MCSVLCPDNLYYTTVMLCNCALGIHSCTAIVNCTSNLCFESYVSVHMYCKKVFYTSILQLANFVHKNYTHIATCVHITIVTT